MPIKFSCPHCKKVLSVKDHLAGKKGPCPSCKKIVSVPMQSAAGPATPKPAAAPTNGHAKANEPKAPEKPATPEPPAADAEAAAAAAFADEPPPEETAPVAFIDFNCPQCDEPLHLSADLAGKRAPCPECKRIIKVPEIKKIEKADWRKTNAAGLPSGARRPDVPMPEGAWGSAASARNVSVEALEEADVLPDKYKQPLTVQQKIMRGLLVAAVAVAFFVCVGVAVAWWMSSRESRSLKSVEDYANSPAAMQKVGREGVGALQIATGEYYLRAKRPDAAKEAQKHFGKAIETLTPTDSSVKANARDALLTDLAVLQIDLAGSKEDIDNKTRLNWNEAQSAIGKTLRAIHNPEARLDAYRTVCKRLIAKKEGKRALALAAQVSDVPAEKAEAIAVAGLEMLAAKDQTLAEAAARDVLPDYDPKNVERPPLTPAVVALALALKHEIRPKPKEDDEAEQLIDRLGHIEGLARSGELPEAQKQAGALNDNPIAQLRAYIELAAAGEASSTNPDLASAISLASSPVFKQRADTGWLQVRVVEVAVGAGVGDSTLAGIIDAIKDPDLAGYARLIVQRHRLTEKNAAPQTPLGNDPPTVAHYQSIQLIARHKRSSDAGNDDAERAFGTIGVLIGNVSK